MNDNSKGVEEKQNRLIEIYKLQSQLASSISDRRTATNRFYLLLMSALAVIFSALLRSDEENLKVLLDFVSIEWIIVLLGVLGITLSWIWIMSINSYLQLNSRKYKALEKLEDVLEYQFFQNEGEFLGRLEKGNTYWRRSLIELTTPGTFFLFFLGLLCFGLLKLPVGTFELFLGYPLLLLLFFVLRLIKWHKIEREELSQPDNER